ncbi:B12-binding domain-containing radical SAM protein [Herbaspirillum sp. RV1423]|uniref:B12-binding domain-containing radical SAM protein n=1 Tax=Herbaspirillum sp. RV1423 TaxID=1443993 RepID=UPI0004BA0044|nr:cobalamin-dependent protein [Herbaspirillum sp. RV1423]
MFAHAQLKRISIIRKVTIPANRLAYEKRHAVLEDLFLLVELGRDAARTLATSVLESFTNPSQVEEKIAASLNLSPGSAHVTGTVEDRLIFIFMNSNTGVVCSLGAPLKQRESHPQSATYSLTSEISEFIGHFHLDHQQRSSLLRPYTYLVSLYHPENFPLPRFSLGISDIARAIRKDMRGKIRLLDMQLGITIREIVDDLIREKPDVLGISATFGQHDILELLLEELKQRCSHSPLIVVGGSLGVLNKEILLKQHAVNFIATGPGEKTMRDIVSYWNSEISENAINDACYLDSTTGNIVHTQRVNNRHYDDILPELDLLDDTLRKGGVMQLESSRGCSYACSFCPREHKGIWAGEDANAVVSLMPEISVVFDRYPTTDRRIFLVDEEFVGYETDELSLNRCLNFAKAIKQYNFDFETSSRIDQVHRPRKDKAWHVNRIEFWKNLRKNGLSRCLFGVESGVDSILQRFNKKTTSHQNSLAIRILTAIGLPLRFTYITFDPLMSFEELVQTYQFLGRTDLVLRECKEITPDALWDGLENEDFIRDHSTNTPFFQHVSYMLVSMEALTNSPYLKMVEEAGLAGELNPLMGRREVIYLDSRIGTISEISQRWIDRSFSLDYLLKSYEKTTSGDERQSLRSLRVFLKNSSYDLLGALLIQFGMKKKFSNLALDIPEIQFDLSKTSEKLAFLNRSFSVLAGGFNTELGNYKTALSSAIFNEIKRHVADWSARSEWTLINGACE